MLVNANNYNVLQNISTGYIVCSVYFTAFNTGSGTYWQNSAVIDPPTQEQGIYISSNAGGLFYAGCYPGTTQVQQGISLNTPYVLEFIHDGVNLQSRLNGQNLQTVAYGASSTFGSIQVGRAISGHIFEMATFINVPTQAERDALVKTLGNWIGASVSAAPFDSLSPTGLWSASRKLKSSYGSGLYYVASGGLVDTLYDQSGNARNVTAAGSSRPTATTVGSIAALQYDGVNNNLAAITMSNFIGTSAGYMIVTARASSIPGSSYLVTGTGGNSNMVLSSTGPTYISQGYDGGYKNTTGISISAGTTYVFEWRLSGGVLYSRVNGGTENSIAVGTLSSLGDLRLGHSSFAGYILEAATFATEPTLSERNALVQAMGTYAGASV